MLHKTRGIVFRFTPYGESSIILNVFTEAFGLQSYIVNSVRTKSNRSKIAIYQPLTLLDMVVYHKENAGIMRIKEVSCSYAYKTLTTDHVKSSLAIFLNEILNKSVREQSHAFELCEFIHSSLVELDEMKGRCENFHLTFLLKLSRYLGFGPNNTSEMSAWLINSEEEELLRLLLNANYDTPLKIDNTQRRNILDSILHFYAAHVDSLNPVKSVHVLREVLG